MLLAKTFEEDVTLPKESILYHGNASPSFNIRELPIWITSNEYAKLYGTYVHTIKVNHEKDLELLNIMHPQWQDKFMHTVYTDNTLSTREKFEMMAPFGLPSLNTQLHFVERMADGLYDWSDDVEKNSIRASIDYHASVFRDTHRFSKAYQNENMPSLDLSVVKYMMNHPTFNKYDGYIAPLHWPSYHHGGFLTPEVCIFRPFHVLEIVKERKGGKAVKAIKAKTSQKAGQSIEFNVQSDIPQEWLRIGKTQTKTKATAHSNSPRGHHAPVVKYLP